jgi:hypothetical protein
MNGALFDRVFTSDPCRIVCKVEGKRVAASSHHGTAVVRVDLASLLPGHLPRIQCCSPWANIAHCLAIFVELDYNRDLCLGFRKMLGPFMAVVQGCENHALGGRRERAPSRKWIGM